MSMSYDPEAIYQDADIEQAEMEAEGARLGKLRADGFCTHGSAVGIAADGTAHYPEAEGLEPGQERCTDGCGTVFESTEDWLNAEPVKAEVSA